MKLYFAPGACSLSPHIVANEAGLALELVKVDLGKKLTSDGRNFLDVTAKGYVPALELDDGRVLTEGPAIVQYIADLVPEKKLLPEAGSFERAKVQEWLNYIATELHKNFGPLFNAKATEEEKTNTKDKILQRLSLVEQQLEKTSCLVSDTFTVADAYLFTVCTWCSHVGVDLSHFVKLKQYIENVADRDSVKKAIAAEKNF